MALRHVQTGAPLRIPARDWNAAMDAARAHAESRFDGGMRPGLPEWRSWGVLPIKNSSGADRDRFDVLGISNVIFAPSASDKAFQNRPALVGVTPASGHVGGEYAVLLQPAAKGAIVDGMVIGITPCRVNVSDASHGFADVDSGVAGNLKSGETGSAQIIWKESGTGVKWAIVRVGTLKVRVQALQEGSADNPYDMNGPYNDTNTSAYTDEWDRDSPPTGKDGVRLYVATRVFSVPGAYAYTRDVYAFFRRVTEDSHGELKGIGPEVGGKIASLYSA